MKSIAKDVWHKLSPMAIQLAKYEGPSIATTIIEKATPQRGPLYGFSPNTKSPQLLWMPYAGDREGIYTFTQEGKSTVPSSWELMNYAVALFRTRHKHARGASLEVPENLALSPEEIPAYKIIDLAAGHFGSQHLIGTHYKGTALRDMGFFDLYRTWPQGAMNETKLNQKNELLLDYFKWDLSQGEEHFRETQTAIEIRHQAGLEAGKSKQLQHERDSLLSQLLEVKSSFSDPHNRTDYSAFQSLMSSGGIGSTLAMLAAMKSMEESIKTPSSYITDSNLDNRTKSVDNTPRSTIAEKPTDGLKK